MLDLKHSLDETSNNTETIFNPSISANKLRYVSTIGAECNIAFTHAVSRRSCVNSRVRWLMFRSIQAELQTEQEHIAAQWILCHCHKQLPYDRNWWPKMERQLGELSVSNSEVESQLKILNMRLHSFIKQLLSATAAVKKYIDGIDPLTNTLRKRDWNASTSLSEWISGDRGLLIKKLANNDAKVLNIKRFLPWCLCENNLKEALHNGGILVYTDQSSSTPAPGVAPKRLGTQDENVSATDEVHNIDNNNRGLHLNLVRPGAADTRMLDITLMDGSILPVRRSRCSLGIPSVFVHDPVIIPKICVYDFSNGLHLYIFYRGHKMGKRRRSHFFITEKQYLTAPPMMLENSPLSNCGVDTAAYCSLSNTCSSSGPSVVNENCNGHNNPTSDGVTDFETYNALSGNDYYYDDDDDDDIDDEELLLDADNNPEGDWEHHCQTTPSNNNGRRHKKHKSLLSNCPKSENTTIGCNKDTTGVSMDTNLINDKHRRQMYQQQTSSSHIVTASDRLEKLLPGFLLPEEYRPGLNNLIQSYRRRSSYQASSMSSRLKATSLIPTTTTSCCDKHDPNNTTRNISTLLIEKDNNCCVVPSDIESRVNTTTFHHQNHNSESTSLTTTEQQHLLQSSGQEHVLQDSQSISSLTNNHHSTFAKCCTDFINGNKNNELQDQIKKEQETLTINNQHMELNSTLDASLSTHKISKETALISSLPSSIIKRSFFKSQQNNKSNIEIPIQTVFEGLNPYTLFLNANLVIEIASECIDIPDIPPIDIFEKQCIVREAQIDSAVITTNTSLHNNSTTNSEFSLNYQIMDNAKTPSLSSFNHDTLLNINNDNIQSKIESQDKELLNNDFNHSDLNNNNDNSITTTTTVLPTTSTTSNHADEIMNTGFYEMKNVPTSSIETSTNNFNSLLNDVKVTLLNKADDNNHPNCNNLLRFNSCTMNVGDVQLDVKEIPIEQVAAHLTNITVFAMRAD